VAIISQAQRLLTSTTITANNNPFNGPYPGEDYINYSRNTKLYIMAIAPIWLS